MVEDLPILFFYIETNEALISQDYWSRIDTELLWIFLIHLGRFKNLSKSEVAVSNQNTSSVLLIGITKFISCSPENVVVAYRRIAIKGLLRYWFTIRRLMEVKTRGETFHSPWKPW